jgi:hypothetical protein
LAARYPLVVFGDAVREPMDCQEIVRLLSGKSIRGQAVKARKVYVPALLVHAAEEAWEKALSRPTLPADALFALRCSVRAVRATARASAQK